MLKQEYPDKQTIIFAIICIKINNQNIFTEIERTSWIEEKGKPKKVRLAIKDKK